MNKIRFIHTADLHLDSPFKGLSNLPSPVFNRLRESSFHAFDRIIEIALDNQVDFILIVGDLFDNEVRSLKAQIAMRTQFERLLELGIQVYITYGNHDHLSGSWAHISWPENVHFFSKNVEMIPFIKDGKKLAHIYGFSYEQRAVVANMTKYYNKIEGAPFHIGMLHGNLEGNEGHDPYAPFTIKQLLEKNFTYWALGHIHKQQILQDSPLIIYPGNIQGRHKNETGEKGCYLIELSSNHINYQFKRTASILWENAQLSIEGMETIDELIKKVQELKELYRTSNSGTILTLELVGHTTTTIHDQISNELFRDEFVEILNDGEENEPAFVWVAACEIHTSVFYNRDDLKNESHFISDLLQQIDKYSEEQMDASLSPLVNNRKFASLFGGTTINQEEILEKAERLLLQELLKS